MPARSTGAGESGQRDSADHTYTVSTRLFAPPDSFGGGFQGDSRGYTTDPGVTSRIHSTVTFDADDQLTTGAEFSKAREAIRNSGNVFTGAYEVGEAGVEVGLEVVETGVSTVAGLGTGTAEAAVGIGAVTQGYSS